MWRTTFQFGQPKLCFGILPPIGVKILPPNQVANEDDQHNGGDDHLTQFAAQHFGDEHWLSTILLGRKVRNYM